MKQKWMEGPKFLCEPDDKWPTFPVDIKVTADDPEVKKCLTVNAVLVNTNATSQLIAHFSDWQKLKVAVAWFLKLKGILLKLSKKRKTLDLANTHVTRTVTSEVQEIS